MYFYQNFKPQSQQTVKVLEYCPAPGQFINTLPAIDAAMSAEERLKACLYKVGGGWAWIAVAVGQRYGYESPGKQRVTLEYGQAVPYALTDTAFLGGFQPRLDFLNALGWLHGVHGVF